MSSDDPDKMHESSDSKKEPKVPPPSPSPSPSPKDNDKAEGKDIFSSKRHSMNYVTVDGVKLRTGYYDKRDWYFICLKELLDNAIDFLWGKYRGVNDAAIDVYIEKTSDSLLRIKLKNTNPKNIEALTADKLNLIFNFDMTAGSKQNLHIISRGILGDA
jgi:hypothetical protein